MWYEEYYPALKKAFFTKSSPPSIIPKPAREQNGLLTVSMNMTINEYVGAIHKLSLQRQRNRKLIIFREEITCINY